MIYVMSDIHGCYEKYTEMLAKLRLKAEDTLYILGDLMDRGADGIKILQDVMGRQNVVALCGNHDETAYIFFCYGSLHKDESRDEAWEQAIEEAFRDWIIYDGGLATYEAFMKLSEPEQEKIIAFLRSMPDHRELTVNGQKYFLSHTVPGIEEMKPLDQLGHYEMLMGAPDYDKVYFEDTILVTGHTPTGYIDEKYHGRI